MKNLCRSYILDPSYDVKLRSNISSKTQKRFHHNPKKLKSQFESWPNDLLNQGTKYMKELEPLIIRTMNLLNANKSMNL